MTIYTSYYYVARAITPTLQNFPMTAVTNDAVVLSQNAYSAVRAKYINRDPVSLEASFPEGSENIPISGTNVAESNASALEDYNLSIFEFNGPPSMQASNSEFMFDGVVRNSPDEPATLWYSIFVNDEFARSEVQILADFNYVSLNKDIEGYFPLGDAGLPDFSSDGSPNFDASLAAKEWRRNTESWHWRNWVGSCIILEGVLGGDSTDAEDPVARSYLNYEEGGDSFKDYLSSGVNLELLGEASARLQSYQNAGNETSIIALETIINLYSFIYFIDEVFLKNAHALPGSKMGQGAYTFKHVEPTPNDAITEFFKSIESAENDQFDLKLTLLSETVDGEVRFNDSLNLRQYALGSFNHSAYRDSSLRKFIPVQQNQMKFADVNGERPKKFSLIQPFRNGDVSYDFHFSDDHQTNFIKNTTASFRHIWSYLKNMSFDTNDESAVDSSDPTQNISHGRHYRLFELPENPARPGDRFFSDYDLSQTKIANARTPGVSYLRSMKIRNILYNARANQASPGGIGYNLDTIYQATLRNAFKISPLSNTSEDDIQKIIATSVSVDLEGNENSEVRKTQLIYCPYMTTDSFARRRLGPGDVDIRIITARDVLKIKKKQLEIFLSNIDQLSSLADPEGTLFQDRIRSLKSSLFQSGPNQLVGMINNFISRMCPKERDQDESTYGNPRMVENGLYRYANSSSIPNTQISSDDFDLAKAIILLTPQNLVAHIGKRKIGKHLFDLSLNLEYYGRLYDYDNDPSNGHDLTEGQTLSDIQPKFSIKVYDGDIINVIPGSGYTQETIEQDFRLNHGDDNINIFSYDQDLEIAERDSSYQNRPLAIAVGGEINEEVLTLINSSLLQVLAEDSHTNSVPRSAAFLYIYFTILLQISSTAAEQEDSPVDPNMPFFSRKSFGRRGNNDFPDFAKNPTLANELVEEFFGRDVDSFGKQLFKLQGYEVYLPESLRGLITGDLRFSDLSLPQFYQLTEHLKGLIIDDQKDALTDSMLGEIASFSNITLQGGGGQSGSLSQIFREKLEEYDRIMTTLRIALIGRAREVENINDHPELIERVQKFFSAGRAEENLSYYDVFMNYVTSSDNIFSDASQDMTRVFTADQSDATASSVRDLASYDGETRKVRLATSIYGVGAGGAPAAAGFLGSELNNNFNQRVLDTFFSKIMRFDRNSNLLVMFSEFITGQLFYGIDTSKPTADQFESYFGQSDYETNEKGILNYLFSSLNESSFIENPMLTAHDLNAVIIEYINILMDITDSLPKVDLTFENTFNDHPSRNSEYTVSYNSMERTQGTAVQNLIRYETGISRTDRLLQGYNAPAAELAIDQLNRRSEFQRDNPNVTAMGDAADQVNAYLARANQFFSQASKILSIEPTFRLKIRPVRKNSIDLEDFAESNVLGILPHISITSPAYIERIRNEYFAVDANRLVFGSGGPEVLTEAQRRDLFSLKSLYNFVGIEKKFASHNKSRPSNASDLSHLSIPLQIRGHDVHNHVSARARGDEFRLDGRDGRVSFTGTRSRNSRLQCLPVKNQIYGAGPSAHPTVINFYGFPVNAFADALGQGSPRYRTSEASSTLTRPRQNIIEGRSQVLNMWETTGLINPRRRDASVESENVFLLNNVYKDNLGVLPPAWYAQLRDKYPAIIAAEARKDELLGITQAPDLNVPGFGPQPDPEYRVSIAENFRSKINEISSETIKGIIFNKSTKTVEFMCLEIGYRVRKTKYKFYRAFGLNNAERIAGEGSSVRTPQLPVTARSGLFTNPHNWHGNLSQNVNLTGRFSHDDYYEATPIGSFILQSNPNADTQNLLAVPTGIFWMPLYRNMTRVDTDNPGVMLDVDINSNFSSGDVANLKNGPKQFPYRMSTLSNLFQYMEKYQPTSTNQHSLGVKSFDTQAYDYIWGVGKYGRYDQPRRYQNSFYESSVSDPEGNSGYNYMWYKQMAAVDVFEEPITKIEWASRSSDANEGLYSLFAEINKQHSVTDTGGVFGARKEALRDFTQKCNSIFVRAAEMRTAATKHQLESLAERPGRDTSRNDSTNGTYKNHVMAMMKHQSPATLLEWLRSGAFVEPLPYPMAPRTTDHRQDHTNFKIATNAQNDRYREMVDSRGINGYFFAGFNPRHYNYMPVRVHEEARLSDWKEDLQEPLVAVFDHGSQTGRRTNYIRRDFTNFPVWREGAGAGDVLISRDIAADQQTTGFSDNWIGHNPTKFEVYYAKAKAIWLQNHNTQNEGDLGYVERHETTKCKSNAHSIFDHAKHIPGLVSPRISQLNGYRRYDIYLGQSSWDLFENGPAYAAPFKATVPWAYAPDSRVRDLLYHCPGDAIGTEELNMLMAAPGSGRTHEGPTHPVMGVPYRFGANSSWCSHFDLRDEDTITHSRTMEVRYLIPSAYAISHLGLGNPDPSNSGRRLANKYQISGEQPQENSIIPGQKIRVIPETVNYVEALQPIDMYTPKFEVNSNDDFSEFKTFRHYKITWKEPSIETVGPGVAPQTINYNNVENINNYRLFDYQPDSQLDMQHGDPTRVYDPMFLLKNGQSTSDLDFNPHYTLYAMHNGFEEFKDVHAPSYYFAQRYGFLDFMRKDKNLRVKYAPKYFALQSGPGVAPSANNASMTAFYNVSNGLQSGHLHKGTNRVELLPENQQGFAYGFKEDYGSPLLDPLKDLMSYWYPNDREGDPSGYKRLYYKARELPITNARSMFMTMDESISDSNPYKSNEIDVDFCKFRPDFGEEGGGLFFSGIESKVYKEEMPHNFTWDTSPTSVPEFEIFNKQDKLEDVGDLLSQAVFNLNQATNIRENWLTKKLYFCKDSSGNIAFWSTEKVPSRVEHLSTIELGKLKPLASLSDYKIDVRLKDNFQKFFQVDGYDAPTEDSDDTAMVRAFNNSLQGGGELSKFSLTNNQLIPKFKGSEENPWRSKERNFSDPGSRDNSSVSREAIFDIPAVFSAPIGKYISECISSSSFDVFSQENPKGFNRGKLQDNGVFRVNEHLNFSSDVPSRVKSLQYLEAIRQVNLGQPAYFNEPTLTHPGSTLQDSLGSSRSIIHNMCAQHPSDCGPRDQNPGFPSLGHVRFHEHEVMGVSLSKFHHDMAARVRAHNKISKAKAVVFFNEIRSSLLNYRSYARSVVGQGPSVTFQPRFARLFNQTAISSKQPRDADYLFYNDIGKGTIPVYPEAPTNEEIRPINSMHWTGGEWRTDWQKIQARLVTRFNNPRFEDYNSINYARPTEIDYSKLFYSSTEVQEMSSLHELAGVTREGRHPRSTRNVGPLRTSFYPYNVPKTAVLVADNDTDQFGVSTLNELRVNIRQSSGGEARRHSLFTDVHGDFTRVDPMQPLDFGDFHMRVGQTAEVDRYFETRALYEEAITSKNVLGLSGRDFNDERTERLSLTKIPFIDDWHEEFPVVEVSMKLVTTEESILPDVYYELDYGKLARKLRANTGNSVYDTLAGFQVIRAHEDLQDQYLQYLLSMENYARKYDSSYALLVGNYAKIAADSRANYSDLIKALDGDSNTRSTILSGFAEAQGLQIDDVMMTHLASAYSLMWMINNGISEVTPDVLGNLSAQRQVMKAQTLYNTLAPDYSIPSLNKMSSFYMPTKNDAITAFRNYEYNLYRDGLLNPKTRVCVIGVENGQLSKLYDSSKDMNGTSGHSSGNTYNSTRDPYINIELELLDHFRPWLKFSKIKRSVLLTRNCGFHMLDIEQNYSADPDNVTSIIHGATHLSAFPNYSTNIEFSNQLLHKAQKYSTPNHPGLDQQSENHKLRDQLGGLGIHDQENVHGLNTNAEPLFGTYDDVRDNTKLDMFLKLYSHKVLGLDLDSSKVANVPITDCFPSTFNDPEFTRDATLGERDYSENLKYNTKHLISKVAALDVENIDRGTVKGQRSKYMKYFFPRKEIPELRQTNGQKYYEEFDVATGRTEVFPSLFSQNSIFASDAYTISDMVFEEQGLQGISGPYDTIYDYMALSADELDPEQVSRVYLVDCLKSLLHRGFNISNEIEQLRPFSFKDPITLDSLAASEILCSVNESYFMPSDLFIEFRFGFKFDHIVAVPYKLSQFKLEGVRRTFDGKTIPEEHIPENFRELRINEFVELGIFDPFAAGTVEDVFQRARQGTLIENCLNAATYLEESTAANGHITLTVKNNSLEPLTIRARIVSKNES